MVYLACLVGLVYLVDGEPREKGETSGKGETGHTGTGLPILYTSFREVAKVALNCAH